MTLPLAALEMRLRTGADALGSSILGHVINYITGYHRPHCPGREDPT